MKAAKAYLLAVTVVLLGIAGTSAMADGDDSNPPGADLNQVTAIEPDARNALEVLDEHRLAIDLLPAEVAERVDENADFGMNPDLSRLAIGNTTHSVFVVPARDHVCASLTVGEGANFVCPSTDEVASGNASPATVTVAGGIAIYGIVPDGVASVSIQTGVSDSATLATEDNAYYTVVPAGTRLRKVSYEGPSGPVDFRIYDPTLVLEGE
jgi:hypothetical protein